MTPPAWFWLLVAWLVARETRLYRSLPRAILTAKRRFSIKGDWSPMLVRSAPRGRTIVYGIIGAFIFLFMIFSLSDPDPDSIDFFYDDDESPFKIHALPFAGDLADDTVPDLHSSSPSSSDEDYERINNSTLGFQKVFVVNLPERTDKRDALTLVSVLTDIKLNWVKAIRGIDVPDKALPIGVDRNSWRDGGIGSWRSQMNVIRTMVEENIASALILEDDADWDVRLKDQLYRVAQGTRTLQDLANEEPAFASASASTSTPKPPSSPHPPHSPYGDDWDILWLGHCGDTFPERIPGHQVIDLNSARYKYYAIPEDATLPPVEHSTTWIKGDLQNHPGVRWVHFSGGPTCSAAYALSQSGARKVLLALSVGGTLVAQLDNAMSDLCRDHTPWDAGSVNDTAGPPGYPGARARCLSVTPAVFSQHKPRGRREAESDIESVEDGHLVREVGESPNLVWSARLNVQNLMLGLPMQDQFAGREVVGVEEETEGKLEKGGRKEVGGKGDVLS